MNTSNRDMHPEMQLKLKTCCKCNMEMIQVARTNIDRLINLVSLGMKRQSRYQCYNCGHQRFFSTAD